MHNRNDQDPRLSTTDKADLFNKLVSFSKTPNFFKMIASFAVGLGMDEGLEDQKQIIKQAFYQMDENPDGCLTINELIKAKDKLIATASGELDEDQPFMTCDCWDGVFQSIDLDGSGRIDFHEFYSATVDHTKLLTKDKLEKVFRTLDCNRDGYLDMDDFKKILPTNLNRSGKVRRSRGPFFETNEKAGKKEEIDMVN
jgi:Ca2+-binding EF-hand superfamily protein